MTTTIAVTCVKSKEPLIKKAAALLKRDIRERSGVRVIQGTRGEVNLSLAVEAGIGKEGFRIENGKSGEIRIIGNDPRGLIAGVGKFLRTSRFGKKSFEPGKWRGDSVPEKQVRGIYFATHFHNFYHDAPIRKVQRYVEDLALWGCNTISVWFDMHHFTGMDDPQAKAMVRRLRAVLLTANSVGMDAALTTLANESFKSSPKTLRADWTSGHDGYLQNPAGHYHVEICPSKPGGIKKLQEYREAMLKAFHGIDIGYVWLWPYDQGGCTCSQCTPWGANGFLRAAETEARLVKKYFPKAKMVLATWYFDLFIRGEWDAFAKVIRQTNPKWFDYIMADDYGTSFPKYIMDNGVPGGYPLVTFPEISMWGMLPWGGFGANPQPARFQSIWDQCEKLASGSFPYSEGIFEDINKAIQLQFVWNSKISAVETLREYVSYEFSPNAADDLVMAAQLMESGLEHLVNPADVRVIFADARSRRKKSVSAQLYILKQTADAEKCLALVKRAEKKMTPHARQSWRWRIFALRAELDAAISKSGGKPTAMTERCFKELTTIFSAQRAEFSVAPPSLGALKAVANSKDM